MTTVPDSEFNPQFSLAKYSPRDALSFCLASRLAYAKNARGQIARQRIREQVRAWGFSNVESFEIVRGRDIDTQGFIAANDEHILTAFRGTESLPDWLANLQTVKDPGPWRRTEVHEGFQDAFHAAALKIGETIGRTRVRQRVWVTGHSLGGALAILLAATMRESNLPVHGLYTFGAPRVGDKNFAQRLDRALDGAAHWRVVNEGDLVPHVPLESFFSHAGNRMLLLNRMTTSRRESVWKRFKKDIWGWIGTAIGEVKLQIAGPHLLDSKNGYLRRLAAQLPLNPDR
jgi:triacylglycerol lipase